MDQIINAEDIMEATKRSYKIVSVDAGSNRYDVRVEISENDKMIAERVWGAPVSMTTEQIDGMVATHVKQFFADYDSIGTEAEKQTQNEEQQKVSESLTGKEVTL